jgi:transcriptional regulator with XRE-family HTH domain
MTLGNRVKEERKKIKWSQTDLAEALGVSQASISEIERGIIKSTSLVIPIAKALKVDPVYLADGVSSTIHREPVSFAEPQNIVANDIFFLSQYDISDSVDSNDIDFSDPMPFSHNLIKAYSFPKPKFLAVLRANGSAMSPTIEHGHTLIINTTDIKLKNAKIYLICIDNTLFLKRFVYTPDGWIMRSDNSDKSRYPDFNIKNSELDSIDIQGCIVWKGGIL